MNEINDGTQNSGFSSDLTYNFGTSLLRSIHKAQSEIIFLAILHNSLVLIFIY
jgi:hypothetical protein